MRILVCGGRNFSDVRMLYDVLDGLKPQIDVLIHGDAKGADRLAGGWAIANKIPVKKYPADWDTYGKTAGYIRNKRMLDEGKPDLVLAFRGGAGTRNMINTAQRQNVKVKQV